MFIGFFIGTNDIGELGVLKDRIKGIKFYKGEGCSECNGSGYRGRTGLYELFIVNDLIKNLIKKQENLTVIRNAACDAGMKTLLEDGFNKVIEGVTTIEEVLRETKEDA